MNAKDNIWSLLFIIAGAGILFYGISHFIIPLGSIFVGLLLINQGLKLKGLPSISLLIKYWLLKFK